MMKCISNRGKRIKAILLLLGVWFLLSLVNNKFIVPPISTVFTEVYKILTTLEYLKDIMITLLRLVFAMLTSIVLGITIGVLCATLCPFTETIKEMLKILQVIPPISILIMAIMWFGLTGIPAIFIVVMSLVPLISIQVIDAIDNIDVKLIEMGKVFKFSKLNMIRYIYLPSVEPAIWSSIIISLTMGAKMIVMGEVLTTSSGIGGRITIARLNIEPESVIAWTIIMMCLYYILEFIVNKIKGRNRFEQKEYFK